MRTRLLSVVLVWCVATAWTAYAQTLDQEMPGLADKISKALVAKGYKTVAALDFTDLQGQPNELGRFLSDQLTVEIVANSSVTMVDRTNIKHILAEHNLTVEGLVNPENAKKLGEFAGVDTILAGNVTEVDDGYRLTVKAISTSSAQIVAAGWITFKKTSTFQDIWNRGISQTGILDAKSSATTGGDSGTSYRENKQIATKDLGSLRVILKSAVPVGPKEQRRGVQLSFEFTNRETQRSLIVAINGVGQTQNYQKNTRLRSSVIDDSGGVWDLLPSGLYGLGFVRVGVHGQQGQDAYNPVEIGRLLRLRDDIGRDADDPGDGYYGYGASCGQGAYGDPSAPIQRTFCPFTGNIFISGSTTTIEPGQSITVTMSFIPQTGGTNSGSPPRFLQFNSEIVVGIVEASMKKSYSLQNLTFDRVSMPAN